MSQATNFGEPVDVLVILVIIALFGAAVIATRWHDGRDK